MRPLLQFIGLKRHDRIIASLILTSSHFFCVENLIIMLPLSFAVVLTPALAFDSLLHTHDSFLAKWDWWIQLSELLTLLRSEVVGDEVWCNLHRVEQIKLLVDTLFALGSIVPLDLGVGVWYLPLALGWSLDRRSLQSPCSLNGASLAGVQ